MTTFFLFYYVGLFGLLSLMSSSECHLVCLVFSLVVVQVTAVLQVVVFHWILLVIL